MLIELLFVQLSNSKLPHLIFSLKKKKLMFLVVQTIYLDPQLLSKSINIAHRGNGKVKIHKTWIPLNTETCFALNYWKTIVVRMAQETTPSELAVFFSVTCAIPALHDAIPVVCVICVVCDGGNLVLNDTILAPPGSR